MICPKCNIENDESSKVCKNCGEIIGQSVPAKRKFSRLAIISFVLGILSLLLTFLTGIPAIICSIISLLKIRKSDGLLKGKGLSIAALLICLFTTIIPIPLVIIWSIDAPPIPNDYTIDDLHSVPEEYSETYQLLYSIEKAEFLEDPLEPNGISNQEREKVRDILNKGTFQEIREFILSKSAKINECWTNAEKDREIIKKLNSYAEIADLTEPSLASQMPDLRNLHMLAIIYRSYILLQTELGNSELATQNLIELDTVIRKLSINARPLVSKLICYVILSENIKNANYISNNPKTSTETIKLISNHFKPLTNEEVGLKNCFIYEYLTFKNTIDTLLPKFTFVRNIIYKRNSTLRVYRNFFDPLIADETNKDFNNKFFWIWPKNYPSIMPNDYITKVNVPFVYKFYNSLGYQLFRALTPVYENKIQIRKKLKTQDDMLQIVLNQRLNRPVNLKARAYSDVYTIDVNDKKIISPGPDKKIGTDDDITMPIEPNMLNLVK